MVAPQYTSPALINHTCPCVDQRYQIWQPFQIQETQHSSYKIVADRREKVLQIIRNTVSGRLIRYTFFYGLKVVLVQCKWALCRGSIPPLFTIIYRQLSLNFSDIPPSYIDEFCLISVIFRVATYNVLICFISVIFHVATLMNFFDFSDIPRRYNIRICSISVMFHVATLMNFVRFQ